ncbi:hypothetical protein BHM03_00019855, partial [Ensete ventricosum]
ALRRSARSPRFRDRRVGFCGKEVQAEMVFYFKARPEAGDYTIFMGLDKHENEELIKYGFPEDIW